MKNLGAENKNKPTSEIKQNVGVDLLQIIKPLKVRE